MDNGPEFIARRTQAWLAAHRIAPAHIVPGRPWQNGVVESFHSRLRDECLDREWFASRAEAAVLIETYRRTYNATHLHSSLGYRTPVEARADYDTEVDSDFPQGGRRKPEPVSL
jgi:transposase InsO family protein